MKQNETTEPFGERVRTRREALRLQPDQMAALLRISEGTLRGIEAGILDPPKDRDFYLALARIEETYPEATREYLLSLLPPELRNQPGD